jgi:hypothetical protein
LQDEDHVIEDGEGDPNWQDRFWNGYKHDENNDLPEVSIIKTTEPREEVKESSAKE